MPTDVPALLALLIQERDKVQEQLAVIDMPFEETRLAAAQEEVDIALRKFRKAQTRFSMAQGVLERIATLTEQIDILTP